MAEQFHTLVVRVENKPGCSLEFQVYSHDEDSISNH